METDRNIAIKNRSIQTDCFFSGREKKENHFSDFGKNTGENRTGGGEKMKKMLWIALLLAALTALGALPFRGTDVAELIPVRTIFVTRSGRMYTVDVGAGIRSMGRTVREALQALRDEASGEVFYDTAEQVIVQETAQDAVNEIAELPELRPAAGLWLTPEKDLNVEAAGDYLSAHKGDLTIMEVRAELLSGRQPRIPILTQTDGGFRVHA